MNKKRIQVQIEDELYEYDEGTCLEKIAKDFQKYLPHKIIVARVNHKLKELSEVINKDCRIEWITVGDKIGEQSYRRTATFILTKAVSEIVGQDTELIVQFSMHKGYYCEIKGHMPMNPSILTDIEMKMQDIVRADFQIHKHFMNSEDAKRIFEKQGMYEKAKLFKYRRSSWMNIYELEGIFDYYYGYMAPSTGYIRKFALIPYQQGFVIQMPVVEAPEVIEAFKPSEKIYSILKESTLWGEKLDVCNAGQLNDKIIHGEFMDLMLVSEALQEKKISSIASDIVEDGKRIVLIAGPSSSGKTTFSHRLSVQLRAMGLKPHPIPVDNYFVDRVNTPKDEHGNYDYECLEAVNVQQFNEDLSRLLLGERVELPTYNFITGKSEYGKNNYMQIGEEDVLVIEGIHCLNEKLTPKIAMEDKYRIYISALTQLNLDEHNRIATTDGRLVRRIVRDAAKRGASAAHTIAMWYSVRRGEEKNIFPYQENADAYFNSALVYELSVLKQYVEPLLFCIRPEQPEYEEAKRLLKFLDYFVGVGGENVPNNSILKEFIGGSCFNV